MIFLKARKKTKTSYRIWWSLSIEQKIALVFIVLSCFIVAVGVVVIIHVSRIYDERMYRISAENTRNILSELDSVLDNVSMFGDYFLGEDVLQSSLQNIKDSTDIGEILSAKRIITKQLNSILGTVPYVDGIAFVMPSGELIRSGSDFSSLADMSGLNNRLILERNGRPTWIYDGEGNVYYAREIRRKEYLRLDQLAVLYLKVNISGIMDTIVDKYQLEDFFITLFYNDAFLYSSDKSITGEATNQYESLKSLGSKFGFTSFNDTRYFISFDTLTNSDWEYVHFLDLNMVTNDVAKIILHSTLILLLVMLFSLMVIHFLIKNKTESAYGW